MGVSRITLDLYFIVHAMLGQYSRDSCYIIEGIPTDHAAGLKFNCDDNICTVLLCFVVFDVST